MPGNLPVAEDIKKLETKRKKNGIMHLTNELVKSTIFLFKCRRILWA